MSISGFDLAQARYDGATPPEARDLTDDPGTACLEGDPDEPCEERTTCYLCGGEVCKEHDDPDDCDGEVVHELCHREGCASSSCAAEARDDALLARDDADRGR